MYIEKTREKQGNNRLSHPGISMNAPLFDRGDLSHM